MSVPDYAEMGRELAENRDATLVNAANRGVKYHEELEAAKQRIAELEHQITDLKGKLAVHDGFQYRFEATMEWQKQRAEAAERKLADAITVVEQVAAQIEGEDYSGDLGKESCTQRAQVARDIAAQIRAPAQIEQPQEPHGGMSLGEFIDLNQQQCSGCGHFLIDVTATQDLQKDSHALAEKEEGDLAVCAECLTTAEQPKQQLPGEDPPFEQCQCSPCKALREKA